MKNNLVLGSIFTLISAILYSTQVAFIKSSLINVPLPVLVVVQSFISLILITSILIIKERGNFLKNVIHSEVKKKHLARTVFSLGISYLLFASLKSIPFFDAVILYNTFPLFIPFIAWMLMKNKINHSLWIFIIMGFAGVLLTFNPDGRILSSASIFALLSGVSTASSIVLMRDISKDDSSMKSMYYYFLFSSIIAGVVSVPFWGMSYLSSLLPLIFIGVIFFFVQLSLTLATVYTTPQVISSLYYSNILFSFLIAFTLFNEQLSMAVLSGALLIILGGFGVIIRERKAVMSTAR